MINPLFADGDAEPMSKKTDPSIDKILDGAENGGWTSYRMHGTPAVVEIDLMVSFANQYPIWRERYGGGWGRWWSGLGVKRKRG